MRGKLLFITGGLVGYVLGARAGRQRYEQIAASAKDLWNAKPVQRRVTEVRDFALEAVGDVPSVLFEAGKKVFTQVQDKAQEKSAKSAKSARSAKSAKSARSAGAQPAPSESASAARTAAAVKVAEAGATTDATAGPTTGAKSRPAKPAAKPATKPSEPSAN
ncbi:hypothetical protein E3T33_05835 [Cryobacterium sp. TMT1-2-1]|uniref:hypothetical protein n=1 Tax=Cryobacterium sp. TMT1-2-1 TaxID=1259232 RepID=UPI00106B17B6|nr:hypothetical protein [Cryobacterium sp. TMT1-2-1]TFD46302.1 hypothetical protein E3T33_05835 [Cryobacterium sp. TMT1-2-1]